MPDSPVRAPSTFLVRWYPILVYVVVVVGLIAIRTWAPQVFGVTGDSVPNSAVEDSTAQSDSSVVTVDSVPDSSVVTGDALPEGTDEQEPADGVSPAYTLFFLVLLFGWFTVANWRYRMPRLEAAGVLDAAELDRQSGEATQVTPPSMFEGHGSLRVQWAAFLGARNTDSPDGIHGVARPSTVSAADFITVESVLGSRHSKLPHALPGIFAAVGLLGTFVGIAIGLEGMDADASPEDISRLVAGMSIAFLTSIVGITQSVWWLIEFRSADRRLESALAGFLDRAEDAFPVEQPHETLFRIASSGAALEGVGETAGRIKGEIQQLGQDLASAFENHLKTYVSDPLRELNTELGHRQQQALNRMVESFQDSLISSVGDQIDAFGDALRSATDHQVRTAKALDRFFDRLEQVADTQTTLLRRTSEVAGVFESGLTRLVEAKEAIADASRLAQETMDAARKLSLECQRQLEAHERATEAAARSWDEQLDSTRRLHRELKDLTTHLAAKVEEFRTVAAGKIGEVFHSFDSEMAKVTDHLSGTMDELREVGKMTVEAILPLPEAVEELRDTTGDLSKVSRAHSESVAAGLKQLEQVHAGLVASMKDSLSDMEGAFGQLPALAEVMRGGYEALAKGSADIGSRLETLSARVEASDEGTLTAIKGVRDTVLDGSGRIENAARTVVGALKAMENSAATGSEALTRASGATRDLARAVLEVRVQVADLAGANVARSAELQAHIERLVDAVGGVADDSAARSEELRVNVDQLLGSVEGVGNRLKQLAGDLRRTEPSGGRGPSVAPSDPGSASPKAESSGSSGRQSGREATEDRPDDRSGARVARAPSVAAPEEEPEPPEEPKGGGIMRWPFGRRKSK